MKQCDEAEQTNQNKQRTTKRCEQNVLEGRETVERLRLEK
jgi:hypothetical protein